MQEDKVAAVEQQQAVISHLISMIFDLYISSQILDTESTHHVVYDIGLFECFDDNIEVTRVILPNGSLVDVGKISIVKLCNGCVIKGVLYISKFKYNLLFIFVFLKEHPGLFSFTLDLFILGCRFGWGEKLVISIFFMMKEKKM